ncbi:stage III sporulation protein AB [Anaeromicropila populeti]|uniref:Stage III sporulation protein AB n=1 Tax=Anaeromicropila populeti TaxID=37658 RepID=A0A1I6ILS8_9FIRM|nr:stage III sporulation protein AB [Anaeromicropila populeti]SFR67611.1 stage III sporulation protein AB [Anaeromicropila populeti]
MILKVIGAILTISSCTALGLYFSMEIRTRLKELCELRKYITILRGDIRYGGTPLPEAFKGLAERSPGSFQGFFRYVSQELLLLNGQTFQEIWEIGVKKHLNDTCLNKQDKDNIISLGENLGHLDREMQINTIDLFLSQLEGEINELSIVVKERTKLYNTLGIMSGIFITIIML